jgi:teichuronic acid biosynthesis glycosyltransferase TuaC
MKILVITNMYPSNDHIYFGIFVKEQRADLKEYCNVDSDLYFINGRKNKLNYLKSILTLPRLIKKNKYDLIHIHFGLSGLFLLFNSFKNTPKVITLHNGDTDKKSAKFLVPFITNQILKKVDKILILNEQHKRFIKGQVHKSEILRCGVNIEMFKKLNIENKFRDEINVLFPGSPKNPMKNYMLFIKVVEKLQLFLDKKVNVHTLGNLNRQEIVLLLNKVDLVLMTSISEGSPQIIKEAMSCEVPIVSTRVGDINELLQGVANCRIIDGFNEEDFVKPIVEIIQTSQYKSNSRERLIESGLDSISTAKKLHKLYYNLLDNYGEHN